MTYEDRFTHTEADAGRFEQTYGPERDNDRPTAADLADEARNFDPFEGMVYCRRDRECQVRFWSLDAPAYRHHVMTEHPPLCVECKTNRCTGRRLSDGATVCWDCTPDDVMEPPWVTTPGRTGYLVHRDGGTVPRRDYERTPA